MLARCGGLRRQNQDGWHLGSLSSPSPIVCATTEVVVADGEVDVLDAMSRQHGIVAEVMARKLGMAERTVQRRKRNGIFVADQPGVLRHRSTPLTWHGQVMAAVLSTGGVASHRTAASLWRVDGFRPSIVEVTVADGTSTRRQGVVVHESTQLELAEVREVQGIPTTGPERLLIDIGLLVSAKRLNDAVDDLVRRSQVTWDSLMAAFVCQARRGRNGIGPMRELLDSRCGATVALSAWGRQVQEMLVEAGLPRPVVEYRILDVGGGFLAQVDLAYPQFRIAIELQSLTHHLRPPRSSPTLADSTCSRPKAGSF
jgi:hypothetical protein